MRLEFGGKVFDLKPLSLNDWIEAEDMGLEQKRLQDKENVRFRDLRTLAYIAIKKVDPVVTLEWVGENISLDNMEVLNQLINFIGGKGSTATRDTSII